MKRLACACAVAASFMAVQAQDPTDAANSASAVTLDQAISSPSTSSSAPPTTYLVYYTENGQQTSRYETFTASTPTPSTTIQPASGTVLAYSSYLPPSSHSSSTGAAAAGSSKFTRSNGQVAAMGLLLSMVMGAVALW
ncbi:hypothetical protein P389DRAFT_198588 [Cystobasidium minutum MCA 4210]|uniref:uncharacterized protein n=1 Tax=Cystobasidium minutum MCA 4210 TaxID=1397322 RepID=UPI0034CE8254|eukprot:jgi/Rhomi1/198588/gm1.6802_g